MIDTPASGITLPLKEAWPRSHSRIPLWQKMALWVRPTSVSRGDVDRAGRELVDWTTSDDFLRAADIVHNWRMSHAYPLLATRMTLSGRVKRVDANAVVAQRLKRLESIVAKLEREPSMALSQMQDIGGCRAVVKSINEVDRLVGLYKQATKKAPKSRPDYVKTYDYIDRPKSDGYRGVHLIYKYRSADKRKSFWFGLRMEIQIRSQLQHAWSTAVETVDTFTNQSLKLGGGKQEWKRFFLLMSTAIAMTEKRPLCVGSPDDVEELKRELRALAEKLNVKQLLLSWTSALHEKIIRITSRTRVFLLSVDVKNEVVRVKGFTNSQQAMASDEYLSTEKARNADIQTVLVSARSLQDLRSAFRNYYADTRVFVSAMERAIKP